MPELKTPATYQGRSVKDWLEMADRGDVLLPNFQRSFVWTPQRTADYLRALLERRPTGIFLILEADDALPFKCRPLHGTPDAGRSGEATGSRRRELLLDGQQRLTSLWGALTGTALKRYLIRVKDLAGGDDEVEEVAWRSASWSNPAKMYRENWIPVDILWTSDSSSGLDASKNAAASLNVRQWCQAAVGNDGWGALHDTISTVRNRLVTEPQLQYCLLHANTDRDTAVDIFIDVNKSAVKLKDIDIAVALAEAEHEADLRTRVADYLDRSAEVGYYFSPHRSKAIPEVAEWMLKVGCLKVREEGKPTGLAPRKIHYPSAVGTLFREDSTVDEAGATPVESRLRQIEHDMDAALRFAAVRGAATKRTLPTWPPVHVIAALQDDVREVGAASREEAERLLSAFLWRGFVTKRYGHQAQDRLLEDYRALRDGLGALSTGTPSRRSRITDRVPAFDEEEYPLPDEKEIVRAGWIGSGSRLGRAVAAVAMAGTPRDWRTGETLDADRVRELEAAKQLERHHIFPPGLFEEAVGAEVKRGVNGVLLAKGPPSLKGRDPKDLLEVISETHSGVDELELRTRVHSHLVPADLLANPGTTPSYRYRQFVEARAKDMAVRIRELVTF